MRHSPKNVHNTRPLFRLYSIITVALLLCVGTSLPGLTCKASATTYYWIAGGNGIWSSSTNWATLSGGAGGAGLPGSADNTVFDSNSGSGTSLVDAGFNTTIHSLTISTGYRGAIGLAVNLTFTGTSPYFSQAGGTFNETYDSAGTNIAALTGLTSGQITATGGAFYGPNKPSGTSGSTTRATRIASVSDLETISTIANLGKRYIQTANIDLSGVSNFRHYMIGTGATIFTGSYNGFGQTISGLRITASENNAGLFSHTGTAAVIQNVGLLSVNVNAVANGQVGGLVGYNEGTVTNSYVTGTLTGNITASSWRMGGLVGYNVGSIAHSYESGTVTGGWAVGGLVGGNDYGGTITDSNAAGDVYDGNGDGGGFVGNNHGTITTSYAAGNVYRPTGGGNTGGFAGQNYTTISKCYATGRVQGATGIALDTGGFVGEGYIGSTIADSYATGNVTGAAGSDNNVGGFVGDNYVGTITNSYSTGNVNAVGSSDTGGFAGATWGLISNSYSTGNATSTNAAVGPFIGQQTGTITRDYYAGTAVNTGTGGVNTFGTGATASSLKITNAPVYTTWTFNAANWLIDAGISYPYLILASVAVSPSTIIASAGNTITLIGVNTSWTAGTPGTPTFTVTGITGASITNQIVTDATHATLTVTGGSSTGTLTIRDPLSRATAIVAVVSSSNATVTSSVFTVSVVSTTAGGSGSITNVPYNTSKAAFESEVTKGQANQIWDDSHIHDPVVSGDYLVVTAQDGVTRATYAITVNPAETVSSSSQSSSAGPVQNGGTRGTSGNSRIVQLLLQRPTSSPSAAASPSSQVSSSGPAVLFQARAALLQHIISRTASVGRRSLLQAALDLINRTIARLLRK